MARIDQTRLRDALLARNLCDEQSAVSIGEVFQDLWDDATRDFASEDKIALAIGDLRTALLEALRVTERAWTQQLAEQRREQAERDRHYRQELAERDAAAREDQATRDRRTQWLIGLGFTAFGVLASVLAVVA